MTYVISEEDFLEHFGVKGMKWGVRKDRSSSGKPGKASSSGPKTMEEFQEQERQRAARKTNFALGTLALGTIAVRALVREYGGLEVTEIDNNRSPADEWTSKEKDILRDTLETARREGVTTGSTGTMRYNPEAKLDPSQVIVLD